MENKEHRNLSQETANCDKQIDKILEMNTEAERRRIAAMTMQGLLASPESYSVQGKEPKYIVKLAVEYADALIAELNKKKDETEI